MPNVIFTQWLLVSLGALSAGLRRSEEFIPLDIIAVYAQPIDDSRMHSITNVCVGGSAPPPSPPSCCAGAEVENRGAKVTRRKKPISGYSNLNFKETPSAVVWSGYAGHRS